MTLETQLANAIAAMTALTNEVQDFVGDANSRINASIAAAPDMVQRRYVDAVAGTVGANGLTVATAMKGIAESINSVPDGRTVELRLLADTPMERTALGYRNLTIVGMNAAGAAVQRRLYFADDPAAVTMPHIYSYSAGRALYLRDINFELPGDADLVGVVSPTYRVHLDLEGFTGARIYGCRVSNPTAAANATAFGLQGSLTFVSLTIDAGAAGHVIQDVAAAADPNLNPMISSNITSA